MNVTSLHPVSTPKPPSVSSMDVVLTRSHEVAKQAAYAVGWPETSAAMLVLLTRDQYDALGRPEQITLTVRPGDRLTHDVEGS